MQVHVSPGRAESKNVIFNTSHKAGAPTSVFVVRKKCYVGGVYLKTPFSSTYKLWTNGDQPEVSSKTITQKTNRANPYRRLCGDKKRKGKSRQGRTKIRTEVRKTSQSTPELQARPTTAFSSGHPKKRIPRLRL